MRPTPTLRLLCSVFVTVLALPAAAADWPQWRGPDRDGRAHEDGARLGWSEEGPEVLWRRPAGTGFSSLAVVDGRLYTAWSEEERTYAVALDAASGAELWRTEIDDAYENERGGGPRSTPTVDGDRLFLVSGGGALVALATAGGELLWRRDLVAELGAEVPIWGFSASPLVVGETVVAPVGGDGQAVAAFDRDDGELEWKAHDDAIGYSSPIVAELGRRRQIVALAGQSAVGLSPGGEVLWSHPWPVVNNINIATPVVVGDDRVFLSTSYDVGATVLEVAPDATAVSEVWRDRVIKNHFQDSVLADGVLYGFDNAFLTAIEAATGRRHWRHRGLGKGQVVLAGDRLVVLGERGGLAIARATPAGYRELFAAELPPQRYWTPPALAGGRLYVRTESEVFALDLRREGMATASSGATAATTDVGLPEARELVRRNIAARGPREAWEAVEAIRVEGAFNRNGRESRLTVWRRGAKVRMETRFGDLTETFVWDGERGWHTPFRGEGAAVSAERLPVFLAQTDTWLPPRDPWSRFDEIEALEPVSEGGETLHRLRVTDGGRSAEWRLSAANGHLVQTHRGDDERTLSTYLLDYRPTGGLLLPRYAEVDFGTGLYSLDVETVELDPAVPEAHFAVPPAGMEVEAGSAAER